MDYQLSIHSVFENRQTSQMLLVKTFLRPSRSVRARRPESAAVRSQDLVYQHDFIGISVKTKFKLSVCYDDPASEGISSRLQAVK